MDHPLIGVGFTDFAEAIRHGHYVTSFEGVPAVDIQHNNLSAVLSETGLIGFIPFVTSQALFVACFWRLRRTHPDRAPLVWKSFLFIFLGYWINGMSLLSGYYADLNLWYMFALAVLYKFAESTPEPVQSPC
jgi:O-antigen ligase